MEIAMIVGMISPVYLGHSVMQTIIMDRKYSLMKTVIIWLVFNLILAGSSFLLVEVADAKKAISLSFLISLILFLIMYLFLSEGALSKRCFMFAGYSSAFMILNTFCLLIINTTLKLIGLSDENIGLSQVLVFAFYRILLFVFFVVFYIKLIAPVFRKWPLIRNKSWWSLTAVAVIFCFLLTMSTAVVISPWYYETQHILLFLGLFLLFVAVYYVLFSSIAYMHKEEETKLLEQKSRYLSAQLEILNENENDSRRTRHDMRHHNLIMAEMAKSGNLENLLKYLGEYNSEIESHEVQAFCENNIINSILISFDSLFRRAEINFEANVEITKDTSVRDVDFVAILANILENALHGCEKSGSKNLFVFISIRKKYEKISIICKNTCNPAVETKNGMPMNPGVGIGSILVTAKKYFGECDFKNEGGVFVSRVVLDTNYN